MRSITVATVIGTPIEEAMASIEMDPRQAVVHLEHDPDRNLPITPSETHLTHGTGIWTAALAELSNSSPPQIDCLISILPLAPDTMGQADREAEAWDQEMTALADSMASISGIWATACIIPDSWPTAAKTLSNTGTGQAYWTTHQTTLQNTYHRGTIETYHRMVCLLQPIIGQHLLILNATVTNPAKANTST